MRNISYQGTSKPLPGNSDETSQASRDIGFNGRFDGMRRVESGTATRGNRHVRGAGFGSIIGVIGGDAGLGAAAGAAAGLIGGVLVDRDKKARQRAYEEGYRRGLAQPR